MATTTSVLIVEPSQMYGDLLRKAFAAARSRFQVIGCVSSAAEVLAVLRQQTPQVTLIGLDLRDGGIQILAEIRRNHPETKVLVLMGVPDRELVTDAFRHGAVGVFNRNNPFSLLCKAVEVVSKGQIWASSEQLHYVLSEFARSPKQPKLDTTIESRITKREAAVVRLAVEGLPNREIARQLSLTEHTVKNYMFRVFEKLGVSNRVELVLSCLRQEQEQREKSTAPRELSKAKKTASLPIMGRRSSSSPPTRMTVAS